MRGVLSWDSTKIPFPNTQDPADLFWRGCEEESGGVTVYEAETMSHSVGFAVPEGWNLSDNGYINATHSFSGETTMTIRARGTYAMGAWPHMNVWISELSVGDVFVNSTEWKDYTFTIPSISSGAPFFVGHDNDADYYSWRRDLIIDRVTFSGGTGGGATAPHCRHTWGVTAYAKMGDHRVPLGGISYDTVGKPTATLTTEVDVLPNGDLAISGEVTPPAGDQTVQIQIKYPNGDIDVIETVTDPGGGFTLPIKPEQRGPIEVTAKLPPDGGPFAPTLGEPVQVDACIPVSEL